DVSRLRSSDLRGDLRGQCRPDAGGRALRRADAAVRPAWVYRPAGSVAPDTLPVEPPDGPINNVNLPPLRVRLTSLSACTRAGPLPKILLTFAASMMGPIIGSAQSRDRRE